MGEAGPCAAGPAGTTSERRFLLSRRRAARPPAPGEGGRKEVDATGAGEGSSRAVSNEPDEMAGDAGWTRTAGRSSSSAPDGQKVGVVIGIGGGPLRVVEEAGLSWRGGGGLTCLGEGRLKAKVAKSGRRTVAGSGESHTTELGSDEMRGLIERLMSTGLGVVLVASSCGCVGF